MNDDTMNSQFDESDQPGQSIEEIMQIIAEATVPPAGTQSLNHYRTGKAKQHKTLIIIINFLVYLEFSTMGTNTGSMDID